MIQAYLTRPDGTQVEYGKTLAGDRQRAVPLQRESVDGSTTLNYNGAAINLCCPGCDEGILKRSGQVSAQYQP
jgi:hypothetical protein